MKKRLLWLSCLIAGVAPAQTIDLEEFASGFSDPVEIVHAGDSRLFVVEQNGIIRILNADGTTNNTPFLNISSMISSGGERGLLGLAFHPDYENNGYFFVNYTNPGGDTVIARFTRSSSNTSVADVSSQLVLLTIDQPYSNHNGGCVRFGPDGYLYIAMGDGGSGGDPENRAQNMETMLGKMLRIDVDNGSPYSVPATNPYVGVAGLDEIWASGLRNPWKFSFNRENGDLWIADVGQNQIEEINKVAGTAAGINYGWRCYEGTAEFNTAQCSSVGIYTMPVAQYTHAATDGCSITGGYEYTGSSYPALQGKYIFTDYCNDKIGVLNDSFQATYTQPYPGNNFTVFAEDLEGELYVAGKTSGMIYRIVDSSMGTGSVSKGFSTIYPNPAGSEFFISLDNRDALIKVYDMGGKLLHQQEGEAGTCHVDTRKFQSGIYLVEIQSATTTNRHKLIIK